MQCNIMQIGLNYQDQIYPNVMKFPISKHDFQLTTK